MTSSHAQLDPVVCYATSDGGDNLLVQDPVTGTWTVVGPKDLLFNEAIAYNPYIQTLYGTDQDTFGTIDVSTGTFTAIGPDLGIASHPTLPDIDIADVDGLTVDPITQIIWASERRTGSQIRDVLFQIDPATGLIVADAFGPGIDYVEIEEVVDTSTSNTNYDVDDLAMDPTTGELYAVSNDGGAGGMLVIVNTTDGTLDQVVGNFGGIDDIEGLGFYNDGVLYGTTGNAGPDPGERNKMYRIDKTTGLTTDLGLIDPSGLNIDFESVDCYTGPPNVITGTVFHDTDEDGVLDGSEAGTIGVTVYLYRDIDGDGEFTPGVDEQIMEQDTGADGSYQFDIASTGDFIIVIDPDDLPDGHSMTTDNEEVAHFDGVGQRDDNNDFGHNETGTIGNFVWFDEDSNGYQDDGEAGIANVLIELFDDGGNLVASTYTDSDGGYLFTDLPEGDYFVNVVDSSLPTGMTQSPLTNADSDFGNQDESVTAPGDFGYPVTIGGTEPWDNLTADFGYNVNPSADVNNPSGSPTAALGDTIWIDSDGDGVQDPGEVGVEGVEVTLYSDPDGDGVYNTPAGTATTDENGFYIFDGLTPDAYVVEVTDSASASHDVLDGGDYTQTGDPDGTADNQSEPIVLGPGDVYLNADFGYQPGAGAPLGSIGDTVWLDLNADGVEDASEAGVAGVTVSLIEDSNGNGIWDPGEPIISTDTTDGNGEYLFDDLAYGDYLVWVNDTADVLDGLDQTFDDDGAAGTPDISGTTISAGTPDDLDQDFGYTPADPVGSIGDTIWADLNNSGGDQASQGNEPGLEGVTVSLFADADGDGNADDINGDGTIDANDVIDTTATDSNGNYLFDNLPLGGYIVEVDTGTLPAGYSSTPTYESDGGTFDSTSPVTLTAALPDNRAQDFSYPPDGTLGTIGDTIWADDDSDGTQNLGEQGIPDVVVALYDLGPDGMPGGGDDVLVGTTTTDSDGNYIFDQLPAGDYQIAVDITTLPPGYDHIPTGDPESDGNNESVVALGVGADDLDQDFGYAPSDPGNPVGSIGDTIYADLDGDGTQDTDDPGIPGVEVTLTDSLGNTWVTYTDGDGNYDFPGLDPDPTITYTVTVDTGTLPPEFNPTPTESGSDGGTDNTSVTTLDTTDTSTRNDDTQDFGFAPATEFGSIGDYVWLDADGAGDQNESGAGIAGVIVELLDADGDVIATTTTGPDGSYYFGGLPLGEDYVVQVAADNFAPGGPLEGMDNTYDSDGNDDSVGEVVTLTSGSSTDFGQDFGYVSPDGGSIGTTVWEDTNADGDIDPGEDGIEGVTVALYRDTDGNGRIDPGEPLVGTTTTDATGEYLFEGLPYDDYIVVVTDENSVLDGMWHSEGTAGADDNSQEDSGYAVTIDAGNPAEETADFGYYIDPATIGNYVWFDTDADGVQDSGEPPIEGAVVTLTITYPDGTVVTMVTETDATGHYEFGNLLLDEDYNGDGGGAEPTYEISVATPADTEPTTIGAGTALTDSNDPAGTAAQPVQGNEDTALASTDPVASYDFGFTTLKADDFASWVTDNGLTGADAEQGANPDGDIYSNALEYALCLHPDGGTNETVPGGSGGFCVVEGGPSGTSGTVDAFFSRPLGGLADVTYTLQVAPGIGSPPAWVNSTATPVITDNGDGTETVTYPDLEAQNADGISRLCVEITGDASGPHYTQTSGWHTQSNGAACETFSNPYAPKSVYSGTSADGDYASGALDVTAAGGGFAAQLLANTEYYIEFIDGTYEGHRFDLDEGASTATSIGFDTANPRNTLAPVPADLQGAYVVRPHATLNDLAPPALFAAQANPDDGDRLIAFVNGAWVTYWVFDMFGTQPKYWTSDGDDGLDDVGDSVIDACQGFFLHPKSGDVDVTSVGVVRDWDFACPLNAGYNLVGSGYPIDQSPDDRAMFKDDSDGVQDWFTASNDPLQADQVLFWLGDTVAAAEGYDTYFRVDLGVAAYDHWTYQGDSNLADADSDLLFELGRAAFYDMIVGHDRSDPADVWVWPAPWAP